MDFFSDIGTLGLGSRLKRLADRIMQDGQKLYQDAGIDFKPAWFPTFCLLYRQGPTPMGQIASELGVTHVAINQVLKELQERSLVESAASKSDRRLRVASLTKNGVELGTRLQPIWVDIRKAIDGALDSSQGDLLTSVSALESALEEKGLHARFKSVRNPIDILPYHDSLKDFFWEINRAWIEEDFVLEEIDIAILKNPQEQIIDRGGAIYFARDAKTGDILGTCALMPHYGKWELTKMGVRKEARGRGIGELLGRSIIDHARASGHDRISLETNSKLTPAITLYKKLGFEHSEQTAGPDYVRADTVMELALRRPV